MKEVVFTACRADQVAYESDKQGDFTRLVTGLLRDGLPEDSHVDFHARIVRAFGTAPRQEPQLNCADASRTRRFCAPSEPMVASSTTAGRPSGRSTGARPAGAGSPRACTSGGW